MILSAHYKWLRLIIHKINMKLSAHSYFGTDSIWVKLNDIGTFNKWFSRVGFHSFLSMLDRSWIELKWGELSNKENKIKRGYNDLLFLVT